MDLSIVLVEPEIPQNTGSIGRMCVCLDTPLHLIEPLGFSLNATYLRRAGLDYWQYVDLQVHRNWQAFLETVRPQRFFFSSTKGLRPYFDFSFRAHDYLVFGRETAGLAASFHARYSEAMYHIPMPGPHARSHNLATAVGIVTYEAVRQLSCPS